MKKLSDYEKERYEGVDVSLEISLFEYGILWKLIDEEQEEYKFIYGVGLKESENGFEYSLFDWATMGKKEWVELLEEDWVELDEVCNFCGMSKEEIKNNWPYGIYDLISYYGYENVFGSSYYPFEIKNDYEEE